MASLFILNGDFDQYLDTMKTLLYKVQAEQEWMAKIDYSIFLNCNLYRNPIKSKELVMSNAITLITMSLADNYKKHLIAVLDWEGKKLNVIHSLFFSF